MPEAEASEVRDRRAEEAAVEPRLESAALACTRLFEMFGDEPSTITTVLRLFVKETGADLVDLATACGSGDSVRIASVAHRVKGAAANIGADPLRGQAARLEDLGRSGHLAEARQVAARVQAEFALLSRLVAESAVEERTVDDRSR